MKILFLGGKTAGLIGLMTLLNEGHRVDVVAYSDDIYMVAKHYGLKTATFTELMAPHVPADAPHSSPLAPYDLLVSVHCRNLIPRTVLDSLPLGAINCHPMLSAYKGAKPILRALEAGERRFSVGVHKMTARIDEGPVLVEKFIEANGEKTEAEVYARLYPLYTIVLSEALEIIQ